MEKLKIYKGIVIRGVILLSCLIMCIYPSYNKEKQAIKETERIAAENKEKEEKKEIEDMIASAMSDITYDEIEDEIENQREKLRLLQEDMERMLSSVEELKLEMAIELLRGLDEEEESLNRELFVAYAKAYEGKIPYMWGGKPSCKGYNGNNFGKTVTVWRAVKEQELKDISDFKYEDYLEFIVYMQNHNYGYGNLSSYLATYYALGDSDNNTFFQYLEAVGFNTAALEPIVEEFIKVSNAEVNTEEPVYKPVEMVKGLDCSGFVEWVYWSCFGINIEELSTEKICNMFTQIPKKNLQIGDLGLIFVGGSDEERTNHVGIYAGKDKRGKDLWIHCNGIVDNVSIDNFDKFTVYYSLIGTGEK